MKEKEALEASLKALSVSRDQSLSSHDQSCDNISAAELLSSEGEEDGGGSKVDQGMQH